MSVICQNFVQNAWKKDLCSNCFKSVGDHDNSILLQNDNHHHHHHHNGNDHPPLKSMSAAKTTTVFQTPQSTPHTTWKTLISEKNAKNGQQPFKLETGFQGRLLTINNKANNGVVGEKKNGEVVKTGFARSASSDDLLNGHSKTNGFHHPTTNGIATPTRGRSPTGVVERKVLVKSKSDESPPAAPLHGILKKTVSNPPPVQSSPRRGSNVGFADEESLVIGYGGRDFSPEELEWDMNVSDGDHGSDSLDETEDDKAFSKMTRQNTEFNSDNANLLKVVPPAKPNNGKAGGKKDEEVGVPKERREEVGVVNGKRDEQNVSKGNYDHRRKKEEGNGVLIGKVDEEQSIPNGKKDEAGIPKEKKEEVCVLNGKRDEQDILKGNYNHHRKKEEGNGVPIGKVDEEPCILNGKRDDEGDILQGKKDERSIPKAKKDDECDILKGKREENLKGGDGAKDKFDSRTEAPMKGNQTVSAGTDNESGAKGDKGGCRDDAPSAPDGNSPLGGAGSAAPPRQSNLEMFDEGEAAAGSTSLPDGEITTADDEWQDGGVAGQILQAINTSLANRHKMNEVDPAEEGERSPVGKVADEAPPVEARTSFLHGGGKKKPPSAIYGPASDLFVTRSDSSSSSSSDEFNNRSSIHVVLNGTPEEEKPPNTHQDHPAKSGKPEVPAKPSKPPLANKKFAAKTTTTRPADSDSSSSLDDAPNGYYSVGNAGGYPDGPKTISLVDHYAESNIYHEVGDLDMKLADSSNSPPSDKAVPRESKLAALAMELEQVRHNGNNTKRQAPAPPKVPEPPLEDPPNSTGRTSPISLDSPHGFSSYRGEAMAFSSSSSTASTSSQDTETGYASWNIHGDLDDSSNNRKSKSSKSSFLLAQYSKCKMLAMGYADDSAKAKKRFSLKKLLKIQKSKESEAPPGFDSGGGPNPKAWKYSDHFERPRAKLEIIHPMDLENRNVTVNPGFDSLHAGSMSSFTASADDLSLRNSVSSDYGSFYSDAMSPVHDAKPEVNYECIPQQNSMTLDEREEPNETTERGGSNSPTPSRTSTVSQASTLTSGSSKNGGGSPHRPPKPPPPPRAHSLLPGSKALNPDGTFKIVLQFPVPNGIAVNNSDPVSTPTKPQAPKRQGKSSSPPKTDCGIYDNAVVDTSPAEQVKEVEKSKEAVVPADENPYGTILDVQAGYLEKRAPVIPENNTKADPDMADPAQLCNNSQPTVAEVKAEPQAINISVKVKQPVSGEAVEKASRTAVARTRNSPATKAPARPPPIYMKSQVSGVVKNPNPWKTLEDSYLVLTAANRELLVKLVNQALKKRKNYVSKLQKLEFQWSDFEIDIEQPSAVFAFGEKIAYHATMPEYPEYAITLVVTVQQQHDRMNENGILKYPVFGHFSDSIPRELLDETCDAESMQATILVLDRSGISTIECFSEGLPPSLSEEHERELCFIILQLIHSLKSLQAHGIESIDPSFQNLVLAKTRGDRYNSLVFLSDGCYDDEGDSCCNKISLCQYTLMLLFQMLGIQSAEEFFLPPPDKFSSETSRRVFETAVSLLSEEKAVSLSQTKTLFECFLWGVTGVVKKMDDSDDVDSALQRWMDIQRSAYIKTLIDEEGLCEVNVQSEYYSQFLTRTSVRSIKEVVSYL